MGIRTRQRLTKAEGALAKTFQEAMRLWDVMKAEGVSAAERVAILAKTLRAAWVFTREWHYLCAQCDDTGLVMMTCRRGARCNGVSTRIDSAGQTLFKYQRLCAKHPDSEYEHTYGTPCFCQKGARFRLKSRENSDDFTEATKVRKPTRIGRNL